uniref:Uncharacterized protein n=1 Tax=Avena sativa TaxID=4498 RepID=A0ACD6AIM8_AVESA
MASPANKSAGSGSGSRPPSRSLVKAGAEDLAAGLSARMGDLLLTDKEATGLRIHSVSSTAIPKPRWALVGKVCSPIKLIISAMEWALIRVWGLHHTAYFKDLGDNRFEVRFLSKGDWRHVKRNGSWQFNFNAILLKDFDGSVRPSDITFDSLDIWVKVADLPMDKMNKLYGELIGGWIGKFIAVDVDEDGMAWGEELRIRVAVRVDHPLPCCVNLKESNEEEDVG